MKKFNTILIIAAVLIILAELVIIATSNFSWSKIFSPILTIIAMILVIIQVVRNFRFMKKQKNKFQN
ncbi:MAG: hypothetical protein AB7S72_06160 [Draconibacterium sp.]